MAVLPLKDEPKCKLCRSGHRTRIDELLEIRSNRGDLDGVKVNQDYVLAELGKMGVVNPTGDNIRIHWAKHCRVIEDEIVEQAQAGLMIRLHDMAVNGVTVDINKDLDKLWAIGMAEMEERIARGGMSGITPEMLMKIAAEKTRRSHNETQDKLMSVLAGGIAHAITGSKQVMLPTRIDDAEVIELEPIGEDLDHD